MAICDDEELVCEELEEILSTMASDIKEKMAIEQFTSSRELCERMEEGQGFQILFLDIAMPDINGIEVGELIRDKLEDDAMQIIYMSAQSSYAMKLFKMRPTDFIIKPFSISQIKQVFSKAYSLVCNSRHMFEAKLKKGDLLRIPVNKILYLCSTGRKVVLYHTKGEFEFYGNIKELGEQLEGYGFIFIHRSYLVNYNQVERITYTEVTLSDGTILEISQSRRKKVKEFRIKTEG